jgi:hypothetical protein
VTSANLDWYVMRPVMRDPPLCTLHELSTVYTIDDLQDFHEAMDEQEEYERRRAELQEQQMRSASRGR